MKVLGIHIEERLNFNYNISYLCRKAGRQLNVFPDSKVHGANMGPIWGRQDPGGPHVGPMNLAIWVLQWMKSYLNLESKLANIKFQLLPICLDVYK